MAGTPAIRHRCEYGGRDQPPTFECSAWKTGKPTRKRCGRCGGQWVLYHGWWAVGSDYTEDGIKRTFRNEIQARRYADAHRDLELVWYFRTETTEMWPSD